MTVHLGFAIHSFKHHAVTFFFIFNLILPFLTSVSFAEEIDLTELSIEELMDIKVTSVSKKTQKRSDSAAAIYVITNEDIRRSGVTNIPDALRLAPGINVARIDSNKWAVSARGFNSRFAANLLVLIDGRSIYTPTFSGVYWENNTVFLEDINRIEVIRGPGATLWGANAMNGVINIITKHASKTKGGLLSGGGGNFEKVMGSMRYGDSLGEDTYWRIFAKGFQRDELQFVDNSDANDDWDTTQAGFRADSVLTPHNTLTLQGDLYQGNIDQNLYLVSPTSPFMAVTPVETDVSGFNMMTRWTHTISPTSNLALQVYYDTTERKTDIIDEDRRNIDIDFQHMFNLLERHDIVWGLRYRNTEDDYVNSSITDLLPLSRKDDLFSSFIQDEISFFDDRVKLTVGSKFEHNDYSGNEIQPSARLMWEIDGKNKVWWAVSRAVRTPSRAEVGSIVDSFSKDSGVIPGVPVVLRVIGSENFDSEELIAYEVGHRFLPHSQISLDTALFYNQYDNIRGINQSAVSFTGTQFLQDLVLDNSITGETYGGELVLKYNFSKSTMYEFSYSFLFSDFGSSQLGGFPKHQGSIRAQFSPTDNTDIDIWLKYVDDMLANDLSSDTGFTKINKNLTLDIRLGWWITSSLELSIVGQNLIDQNRIEMQQESFGLPTENKQSFYAKLTYQF